jgi:hypothetical protein
MVTEPVEDPAVKTTVLPEVELRVPMPAGVMVQE